MKVGKKKAGLIKRCEAVTAAMLRSVSADIDDYPNAEHQNSISGFIVSYTDIPQVGEYGFRKKNLMMTSEYVRKAVLEKMSLQSPLEYLHELARIWATVAIIPKFGCLKRGRAPGGKSASL